MNEPDRMTSPGPLCTGTLSPVSMDSLTSHSPLTMTESAQICLPDSRYMMSSSTTSRTGMALVAPSRTTIAVGAVTSFKRSMVIFDLISSTMPMMVFADTMTTNRNLLQSLLMSTTSIMAMNMTRMSRLRYVNRLEKIMRAYDLPTARLAALTSPSSVRLVT